MKKLFTSSKNGWAGKLVTLVLSVVLLFVLASCNTSIHGTDSSADSTDENAAGSLSDELGDDSGGDSGGGVDLINAILNPADYNALELIEYDAYVYPGEHGKIVAAATGIDLEGLSLTVFFVDAAAIDPTNPLEMFPQAYAKDDLVENPGSELGAPPGAGSYNFMAPLTTPVPTKFIVFAGLKVDNKAYVTQQPFEINVIAASSNPTIKPKAGFDGINGFDGPTPPPPPFGSGPGANAKAIARFFSVNKRTLYEEIAIGVIAYHINGIDRVEFAVEGGKWETVTQPSTNPDTGIKNEYWVKVNPDDFPDGPPDGVSLATKEGYEIRAIAYPKNAGEPRLLSLYFSTNAKGTLPETKVWVDVNGDDSSGDGTASKPVRTIARAAQLAQETQGSVDGATAYLNPGTYDFGPPKSGVAPINKRRWFTISAAPGVDRSQAILQQGSDDTGLKIRLVKLENLTLTSPLKTKKQASPAPLKESSIYLEGVRAKGPDQQKEASFWFGSDWTGRFAVNTETSDAKYCIGATGATLIAFCYCHEIGSDVFNNVGTLVNNLVINIQKLVGAVPPWHPDSIQYGINSFGDANAIAQGNTVLNGDDAQGPFVKLSDSKNPLENIVYANNVFETGVSGKVEPAKLNHILFINNSIDKSSLIWRNPKEDSENVMYHGNISNFKVYPATVSVDEAWFKWNHFLGSETYGDYFTTGDPGYIDPANDNYGLLPTSPNKDVNISPLFPILVPMDGLGVDRATTSGPTSSKGARE